MHRSYDLTLKKKMVLVAAVMGLLGLLIFIKDFIDNRYDFSGQLERNDAGKGVISEDLEVEFFDNRENISFNLQETSLSSQEVEAAFDKAVSEIDATYLGENISPSQVCYDLVLNKKYADDLISAKWQFDDYGIITSDGQIQEDKTDENGTIVEVTALLSYGEYERDYSFSIVIYPLGLDTYQGQLYAINQELEKSNGDNAQKEMKLPESVGDMTLTWKKKMDYRGLVIVFLGIVAALAIYLADQEEKKKAKKEVENQRLRDYPLIVSDLSILMAAGMSFRVALERITGRYLSGISANPEKKSAGYEDMVRCYKRLVDGAGEMAAIELLGKESEAKEYRKLSMLLAQNLRKGSKDLIECLEKEEASAFEQKKQRAIRAGEEASTKLLLPMGGMLLIVIVVLVVPAVMQMNI